MSGAINVAEGHSKNYQYIAGVEFAVCGHFSCTQ